MSRVSLLVVGLCFATILLDGYDLVVYGTVIPALLAEPGWNLTTAGAGYIGSAALVGMAIGAICVGVATDTFGRRRILIACTAWFSAMTLVCAFVVDPVQLGVVRFLAGLAIGGFLPTAITTTMEFAPRNRAQLFNSIIHVGYSVGGVIAALVAIVVIADFGWRPMFVIGAVPALIVVPLLARYLPESPSFLLKKGRTAELQALVDRYQIEPPVAGPVGTAGGFRGVSKLFSKRYIRNSILFALISFCGLLLSYGMSTWLPAIMREAGYGLGSALTFLVLLNAGNIVGSLSVASFADKVGSRRVILFALTVAAGCIFILSLGLPTLVLYMFVMGAGFGAMGTQIFVNGMVAASYPSEIRATGIGWANGFGRLGAIAGPSIGGLVLGSSLGYQWNFYLFVLTASVAAALVLILGVMTRRANSESSPEPTAHSQRTVESEAS